MLLFSMATILYASSPYLDFGGKYLSKGEFITKARESYIRYLDFHHLSGDMRNDAYNAFCEILVEIDEDQVKIDVAGRFNFLRTTKFNNKILYYNRKGERKDKGKYSFDPPGFVVGYLNGLANSMQSVSR